jgi:hypothetical protein
MPGTDASSTSFTVPKRADGGDANIKQAMLAERLLA